MRFGQLPRSEHPLVALRPIEVDDLPLWAAYLSLPAVYEHTSWTFPTAADLAGYAGSESSRASSAPLRLAVATRSTNQLVGTIGFHTVSAENRSAELTYDLEPGMWGRGIVTYLGAVMVAWAHEHAGVVRVQATVLEANIRSIRVLERVGFVREGLLRSYRHVRGAPADFYMYAHLRPGR